MSDLASLLEKVRSAKGADSDLDRELVNSLGFHAWAGRMSYRNPPKWVDFGSSAVTGSIDAASALVERRLPGWVWGVTSPIGQMADGMLWLKDDSDPKGFSQRFKAEAPTAPLAILSALLTALITQETPNGN